jgi:hypothetical protein
MKQKLHKSKVRETFLKKNVDFVKTGKLTKLTTFPPFYITREKELLTRNMNRNESCVNKTANIC